MDARFRAMFSSILQVRFLSSLYVAVCIVNIGGVMPIKIVSIPHFAGPTRSPMSSMRMCAII